MKGLALSMCCCHNKWDKREQQNKATRTEIKKRRGKVKKKKNEQGM
jgi:hypothetical protein